jgi:hypothetical protein
VSFASGSGAVDEFGIGGGSPAGVIGMSVRCPPFGQAGAGVWEGAFEDLEGCDSPGTAYGGEDSAPEGDAAFLFAGVKEHECGMCDFAHHGQGCLVGVVDHPGSGVGVGVLA